MIELPNVTVIIADTKNYGRAAYAIVKTLEQIKPAKTVWLTDIDYNHPEVEVIKISPIKDKADYSRIMVKDLTKYFQTDYCLTIQHDGYCIHGDAWNNEFYNWDFIGAPWLYPDPERNVGNDGFSLKSKRLCDALANDDFIEIVEPCDEIIGRLYRRYLEQRHHIKYAPEELADTFSYELRSPICKTLGFHGYFHAPYQETVMISRTGALGDIVALEPLLHYYYKKGYRVILNTLPQFYGLFVQHYFKVHHPGELDGRLKYREINLDMAYEVKPKQLHLKSYFEACGVPEGEIGFRNPRLTLSFDPRQNKLFPKSAVIHYDHRPQGGRNIYGVEWRRICITLQNKGYTVIQIGMGDREPIKEAIQMNTPTELMMMWVIGGADLFIGCDSGPANIAIAMGVPSIVMFGNVEPEYIYPEPNKVKIIQDKTKCNTPKCWHEKVTTVGQECVIDEKRPPCAEFDTNQIIDAINELI
jgi:ADP-heptose:LPS heptosyltransferase